MKMTCFHMLLAAMVIAVPASAQSDTATLAINQPAPRIKVQAWLRGEPVDHFKKGRVYVMEFGSISCGPCRMAIPHLTELARKYNTDVDVISVFIYENSRGNAGNSYVQKVRTFIDKQGPAIGYKVAVDDEEQTMAKTWYEPAARRQMVGLPATFVIDRTGQIVWIGSPFHVEHVIAQVVKEAFDPVFAVALQRNYDRIYKRIFLAKKENNYPAAVRLIDSLISKHPEIDLLYLDRFSTILDYDMNSALEYGRHLLSSQCHDDEAMLNYVARAIISKSHIKKYREFTALSDMVLYLTDRALVLSKSNGVSSYLYTLQAQAYANKGLFSKAVEKQELAIKYYNMEKTPDQVRAVSNDALEQALKLYKTSLPKSNGF